MTGAPWAIADTGTAVTFTAASTSTVCAYYTKAIGGQCSLVTPTGNTVLNCS
jgi:hypothetical protein